MNPITVGNPWDIPALIDLAANFECPEPAMLAAITLWAWCAENCPNGLFIGRNAAAQIELAARWNGRCSALVEAMLDAGIVEKNSDGLLVINDEYWNAAESREGGER